MNDKRGPCDSSYTSEIAKDEPHFLLHQHDYPSLNINQWYCIKLPTHETKNMAITIQEWMLKVHQTWRVLFQQSTLFYLAFTLFVCGDEQEEWETYAISFHICVFYGISKSAPAFYQILHHLIEKCYRTLDLKFLSLSKECSHSAVIGTRPIFRHVLVHIVALLLLELVVQTLQKIRQLYITAVYLRKLRVYFRNISAFLIGHMNQLRILFQCLADITSGI